MLDRQSLEIAEKLKQAGVDMFAPAADEPITLLGDLTGAVEESNSTRFRHSLFIPSVAKRDRASQQKRLEAYLQGHRKGEYARYMVITNGVRIPWMAEDLRDQVQAFHRSIGIWRRAVAEQFGVEIVTRSSEMTLRDLPGMIGKDGVHLHANVLYVAPKMTGARWGQFLSFTHRHFGSRVQDCGRIRDLAEVVKYVTKPSVSPAERAKLPGLVGMCDLSPDRLAWLHAATAGLHIFQPYAGFRAWSSELREAKQKLYRLRSGRFVRVDMPPGQRPDGSGGSRENILVGRTLPQPRFSAVYEPVSVVLNFTTTPQTSDGKKRLAVLLARQKAAQKWAAANAAAAYSVHNSTITPILASRSGDESGVIVRERPKEPDKLELSG
ncbi:hypothetical protein [Acetobacter malorum]|uniref:hypothetical protein n=1 Tax=Acetobacter malorum TaxID=178901 RepID=UPI0012E916C5|nr:hypothetical protein [Acetobacter malorum]